MRIDGSLLRGALHCTSLPIFKPPHVAELATSTFTSYTNAKAQAPEVGNGVNAAFPGGPPMIPHQIQMRENCISCHAGPSAPKEIRVTHPERVNCRQCHLPMHQEWKPSIDPGSILREFDELNEK